MKTSGSAPRRVVIVGGGYTGASAAVQLVQRSGSALDVTLIEPRAGLGQGVAYASEDPDHRVNGPSHGHLVDPADPLGFHRWYQGSGMAGQDPQARVDGVLYPRRLAFGQYVGELVRLRARDNASGSRIEHLRDTACRAEPVGAGWRIATAAGKERQADLLLLATGNAPPRLPAVLARAGAAPDVVVASPWQPGGLPAFAPNDAVLVLGTGLTALDVLSTLLRRGHRGPLIAVSRRGLRPTGQPPAAYAVEPQAGADPFKRLQAPLPSFLGDPPPRRVHALLRALRREIHHQAHRGQPWQVAFDALRDAVWRLWPALPLPEQRRFLSRLRTWYDVHRFRAPPQNDALVRAAAAAGQVCFAAAHLLHAQGLLAGRRVALALRRRGEDRPWQLEVGAIVNCTGLDPATGAEDNPLLQSLIQAGHLCADPTGVGFAVDDSCRVLSAQGIPQPTLRMVGPPTTGHFGDPLGTRFIAAQLHRIVPDLLGTLGAQAPALSAA